MSIEVRRPTDDEWPAVCRADGRAFGFGYSDDDIERKRPIHDMSRFRIALDDGRIVAVAGSYEMEVTLPGGALVPMGGVTWVSTAATHRRQGLMRRVVGDVHADITDRGEPLATLSAAEGGIYERLGYGASTLQRYTTLDPRLVRFRDEFRQPSDSVRYLDGDEVAPALTEIWDRFRRTRAGETAAAGALQRYFYAERDRPVGAASPAAYLVHRDGFAAYRTTVKLHGGVAANDLELIVLAAVTSEAHAALWQTLLGVDLVGSITSRSVAIDDPLPFLLDDPRALRTTAVNDGIWVNVLDPARCFGERTYRTDDRFVVEADGTRWAIEGGPAGGACRRVRSRPDLVTSHASMSALLYGGVAPSALAAGRRLTARDQRTLERADLFFPTTRAPHCQSYY